MVNRTHRYPFACIFCKKYSIHKSPREPSKPSNMSTITLISGANQGIGLATATRLAKEYGHHVIIGSRNADAGAKVAASIQAEGHAASSVQLDLSSDNSIAAAAKAIEQRHGRLDVLINNAGVLLDRQDPRPEPPRALHADLHHQRHRHRLPDRSLAPAAPKVDAAAGRVRVVTHGLASPGDRS